MSHSLSTPEILNELFLNSDKSTIYNSLTVSRQWNELLNKEYFWKQYYEKHFSDNKKLNNLVNKMPNHSYKNLCKFKMANKQQCISNLQDKQNFPVTNLSNLTNFSDDVMCIKQDCMIWFDKEKLTLNYVEFADPNDVREFHVGSNIIMVDVIDNLIVSINSDYIIILYSRSKQHTKWHARLVNEPEHENGEFFIVNSCILDNLITISFFELLQQAPENEEEEEDQEHQGEFKIFVWDLSLLVEALKHEDVDENYYYDIKVRNLIIPINFNPVIVHNCAFFEKNEKTGELEKNYYIMSCTADDGIISIYTFDENLKSKGVTNYMYNLEDDVLLWGSIHKDGTILAIGKKEIEIFSVNDTDIEQHRKIPADIFDSFNLFDIILTPELLYIMMFVQPQEGEEEGEEETPGEVRIAVVDISDDKKETQGNNKLQPLRITWNNKEVCYNRFVETGIVQYNPDINYILFTPFSKYLCKN